MSASLSNRPLEWAEKLPLQIVIDEHSKTQINVCLRSLTAAFSHEFSHHGTPVTSADFKSRIDAVTAINEVAKRHSNLIGARFYGFLPERSKQKSYTSLGLTVPFKTKRQFKAGCEVMIGGAL